MREENVKRTYATWDELSLERKQEEIERAIENDTFWDNFNDQFYQEYLLDLEAIQDKHNIALTPVYTRGSQHGLLCFELDGEEYILEQGVSFYFDRQESSIDFVEEEENIEENQKIEEDLQKRVDGFIEDFHKMYEYYKEFFMYGNCDQYKEYVKDQLEYNEDYEYLIEEKVVDCA